MKKICIFLLLLLCANLFSQNSTESVFAPFVSRLKASSQGLQIILTWKNSTDVMGKKNIYRYDKEITDTNYKEAELIATVGENIESYTDTPKKLDTKYYYAVLIQNKNGRLYKIFIPYRNKTTTGAVISLAKTENKSAAVVSDLTASASKNKVVLNFKSSRPDRTLMVYRSTQPIYSAADILKASFSQTVHSSSISFTDVPIAGVDYYYAVIDAGLVESGEVSFTKGENTLEKPVSLAISSGTMGIPKSYKRAFPLPALNILWDVESGVELETPRPLLLPSTIPVKPATQSAINALKAEMEKFPAQEKQVEILSVDKTENAGGEADTLKAIITGSLSKKQFPESELRLKDFLQTHHSPEVEARTHFYLAQAYYFQKKYRPAFLEFLLAEDTYYAEVQSWLTVCFNKINSGSF
jgi:hypothetical protein